MKSTSNGIVLFLPSTRGTASFKIRLSPYIEAGRSLWCRHLVLLCGCVIDLFSVVTWHWLGLLMTYLPNITKFSVSGLSTRYSIFVFLGLSLWSYFNCNSCSWLLLLCWTYPCLPSKEGFLTVFSWKSQILCIFSVVPKLVWSLLLLFSTHLLALWILNTLSYHIAGTSVKLHWLFFLLPYKEFTDYGSWDIGKDKCVF